MSPDVAADREAGRASVADLCEAFGRELGYYKSAEFDETTTRQRFIDPLFAALGWDVADQERRGPYADVILEYSLATATPSAQLTFGNEDAKGRGGSGSGPRKPDQNSLPLGARITRFVSTGSGSSSSRRSARPFRSPAPTPIFQVKSYAWSAGVTLALLTDFEDLRVFDCRHRPVIDEPDTGLVAEFNLNFREYVEAWDLLWDTFSRPAVARGSLVRFAEEIREPRGTAARRSGLSRRSGSMALTASPELRSRKSAARRLAAQRRNTTHSRPARIRSCLRGPPARSRSSPEAATRCGGSLSSFHRRNRSAPSELQRRPARSPSGRRTPVRHHDVSLACFAACILRGRRTGLTSSA